MRQWAIVGAVLIALVVAVVISRSTSEPAPPEPGPTLDAGPERIDVRAAQDEVGHTLEGRVLDASGAPISRAEVHLGSAKQPRLTSMRCKEEDALLLECRAPEAPGRVAELLSAGQGRLEAGLSTTSDSDGRFRFEHLRGDSFTVWARGATHGVALRDRVAPGEFLEVTLPPLRALQGRVLGDRGVPYVDARVWAVSRKTSLAVEVRSQHGGRFELQRLGEGPFYVVAAADGYLAAAEPDAEVGLADIELQLRRPRELVVSVLRNGKPAEATVELTSNLLVLRADTQHGSARIGGLGRRKVVVRAWSGSLASVSIEVNLHQQQTAVTLHLLEGGTLWVTAVDGDGQPVPSPTLRLQRHYELRLQEVSPGTGAPAAFGPIAPGEYALIGEAQGFEPAQLPIRLKPGETSIELTMQRGTTISGRVLDLHGRGVPSASVQLQPVDMTTHTDLEGRFSLLVPSPGEYQLQAYHSDWGRREQVVSAPAENLELLLESGASLRVLVTCNGRPIEGASVNGSGLTGPDGVLWMRGLPPGPFLLGAEHPAYIAIGTETVLLLDGQEHHVTATFAEFGTLVGEVVDTDGAPVGDASIGGYRARQYGVSDASGRFTSRGVDPDELSIYAWHPDYAQVEKVRVHLDFGGVAEVRLVLKRRSRSHYRGRVVSGDGKPLTRFEVNGKEFSDPSGHFEFSDSGRDPRRGNVIAASFSAPGYQSLERAFPAESFDLGTIQLEPEPTVSGRVVDERGDGVARALVTLSCFEDERRTLTGEGGQYEISCSTFEIAPLLSASQGSQIAERTISLNERKVDLVLRHTSVLTGIYYGATGSPQGGVILRFDAERWQAFKNVVTGSDGGFRVEGSPGHVSVSLAQESVTRSITQVVQLGVEGTQIRLGRPPGTFQLTVKAPPYSGWLAVFRGDVAPQAPLYSKVRQASWAQHAGLSDSGSVTFPGLTPGPYTVVFERSNDESALGQVARRIDVRGDQTLTIEVPERAPQ